MSQYRYTASEWAAMQGGHSVEPASTELSFIQSLGEARMYKTREQIKRDGARSVADHLFVSLLSLYTMANDYKYAPVAKGYAQKTMQSGGSFSQPSPSGTDLYQTLFTLNKPQGLINSEADQLLLNKVKVNNPKIKKFMMDIQTGQINPGQAQAFFFKLERDLAIQDPKLRAARRLAQNWSTLTTAQRQLVATQLNRYFTMNAKRSDLRPLFTNFAKDSGLVVADSKAKKIGKRIARGAAAFAGGYALGKMLEL
jgi:hypothetical protein